MRFSLFTRHFNNKPGGAFAHLLIGAFAAGKQFRAFNYSGGGLTEVVLPATFSTTAPGQTVVSSKNGEYTAYGWWGGGASNTTRGLKILRRKANVFVELALPTLDWDSVSSLDFTSEGTKLAIRMNAAPYIAIFNISGDIVTRDSLPTLVSAVSTATGAVIAFSKDNRCLLWNIAANLYCYDFVTNTRISIAAGNTGSHVGRVVFSDDGNFLLASSTSHTDQPILYSYSNGIFTNIVNKAAFVTAGVTSLATRYFHGLAISSDGTYIYIPSSGTYKFYLLKRVGSSISKLTVNIPTSSGTVCWTRFSPDNTYLYIGISATTGNHVFVLERNGDTFTLKNQFALSPYPYPGAGHGACIY